MFSKWIKRVFNHQSAAAVAVDCARDKQAVPIPHEQSEISAGSTVKTKANQQRLDTAFFAWLLESPETELSASGFDDKKHKLLKRLDQDFLNLECLPRRPASLPMLIKMLNDEDSSHVEMANVLITDPSLTTQIIKTANSPFFRSSGEPIESINQAVLVLGRQGIRNIISAVIMQPMMKGHGGPEKLFSQKVWKWAILSATASDHYAQLRGEDSGPLYLLGILPSLSYLIIYRTLLGYQQNADAELANIEPALIKAIIEKTSWQLCHDICEQWGLPDSCKGFLLSAEKRLNDLSTDALHSAPLKDGLMMGQYLALDALGQSPLEDDAVFNLSSAPANLDKKVIQHLNKTVNLSE
jgi:HD-like signal output (HDOD) protein